MSSDSPNRTVATNSNRTVARAVVDLARDRLTDHLRAERRAGRTVVTLVELSQATSLDPGTVEAVMELLANDPERDVRRSGTDALRWYL